MLTEAAHDSLLEVIGALNLSPALLPRENLRRCKPLETWAAAHGVSETTVRSLIRERLTTLNAANTMTALAAVRELAPDQPLDGFDVASTAKACGVSVGTMTSMVVEHRLGSNGLRLLQLALEASSTNTTPLVELVRASRWTEARQMLRLCPSLAHLRGQGHLPLHLACMVRNPWAVRAHATLVSELLAVFPAGAAVRCDPGVGEDHGQLPLELCLQGPAADWPLEVIAILVQHNPVAVRQLPTPLRNSDEAKAVLDPLLQRIPARRLRELKAKPEPEDLDRTYYSEPSDFYASLSPSCWAEVQELVKSVTPEDVSTLLRWAALVRQRDLIGGPLTTAYRQAVATEGEKALEQMLTSLGFEPHQYATEAQLRAQGCRVTPDVLFHEPVDFPGCATKIRFVEVKAGWLLPGLSDKDKEDSFVRQINKYTANHGPGVVLWRRGFSISVCRLTCPAVTHLDYETRASAPGTLKKAAAATMTPPMARQSSLDGCDTIAAPVQPRLHQTRSPSPPSSPQQTGGAVPANHLAVLL